MGTKNCCIYVRWENDDFRSHREAVRDLIEEIKSDKNQLKYGLGEKDRTKTIITVEAYIEELEKWQRKES